MPKVVFNSRHSAFYTELKKNVENYFSENHLRKTGNWRLYWKALTLVPAAILLYILLITVEMHVLLAVLLSGLFGFTLASIGFNVMHDACHGSYSSKKWLNDLLGLTLNALGGNAFIWKFKHNIIHHTYTNVDGIDDDIAKSPLMRQCSTQKWFPAHRFQHIYVVLFYSVSSFAWVFVMDFVKYFSHRVFRTELQKMNSSEHVIFWLTKLLYIFFYIALPVMLVGWQAWAIGFVSFHIVMGLTLAMVFQLAHVVEHAEFELVVDQKHIEDEWAVHQLKTTANFAPRSPVISWFVGGLNYQVEHHLFPRISHVHYPRISEIVSNTCKKYDLPYNVYATMSGAVASHFRMMKNLGRKPI